MARDDDDSKSNENPVSTPVSPASTPISPSSPGFNTDQLPFNTSQNYSDEDEASVDPHIIRDDPEDEEGFNPILGEEEEEGEDLFNDDFMDDYQRLGEQDQYEPIVIDDNSIEDERDLDQIMADIRAAEIELEAREVPVTQLKLPRLLHDQDTDDENPIPSKRTKADPRTLTTPLSDTDDIPSSQHGNFSEDAPMGGPTDNDSDYWMLESIQGMGEKFGSERVQDAERTYPRMLRWKLGSKCINNKDSADFLDAMKVVFPQLKADSTEKDFFYMKNLDHFMMEYNSSSNSYKVLRDLECFYIQERSDLSDIDATTSSPPSTSTIDDTRPHDIEKRQTEIFRIQKQIMERMEKMEKMGRIEKQLAEQRHVQMMEKMGRIEKQLAEQREVQMMERMEKMEKMGRIEKQLAEQRHVQMMERMEKVEKRLADLELAEQRHAELAEGRVDNPSDVDAQDIVAAKGIRKDQPLVRRGKFSSFISLFPPF